MKAMLLLLVFARAGDGCGSSSPATTGSAGSDKLGAALERFAAGSSAGSPTGSAAPAVADAGSHAATPKNLFPGDGPEWTKARMAGVAEVESGKDHWDDGNVRKMQYNRRYGRIYIAYRCDDHFGCRGSPGGSGWDAIGWSMM